MAGIPTIKDKILIKGTLKLLTGMHIGASNEFAPIGAVDSIVVRDPMTSKPIIPGSSLKGKMRTLLVKAIADSPVIPDDFNKDTPEVKRLFGASSPEIVSSRLQFCDLFMTDETVKKLDKKTDLFLTEIKFENTIGRKDAGANPRQLERVPAGSEFDFSLVYNVEDESHLEKDFENIALAIKLLHLDYIGGSGTRGYGKVKISNISIEMKELTEWKCPEEIKAKLSDKFKGCEEYAILSV